MKGYVQNQCKGPSIKVVRSQRGVCPMRRGGEGSSFSAAIRKPGLLNCGRPHFLVKNTTDFSKLMVCPHRQGGGVSKCGRLRTWERGQFFTILCGRLLWTAP